MFTTFMCQLSGNLGASKLLEPSGLVQAIKGLLYLFASSNKAVLHTVRAEDANIKASYVSINSMMMG
jgi:hypothetical protein